MLLLNYPFYMFINFEDELVCMFPDVSSLRTAAMNAHSRNLRKNFIWGCKEHDILQGRSHPQFSGYGLAWLHALPWLS